jgi:cytochrome c oxidase subunit 3
MWIFLGSESLLFAGLMLAYALTRRHYPQGFAMGSRETSFILGTLNTGVLLTSSLLVALAELRSETERRPASRILLLATAGLGVLFLAIKSVEYVDEIKRGLLPLFDQPFRYAGPDRQGVAAFFRFYFMLTGLHAVHLIAGIALVLWTAFSARTSIVRNRRRVAATALYWHFVDIVWVFLYPLLYLVSR